MTNEEMTDLDFFINIATSKSLTSASVALNIPLPTVSRRLGKIEKLYNKRLINRSARQFQLTEAGSLLLEKARYISVYLMQVKEEVSQNTESLTGKFRIGTLNYFGRHSLSSIVAKFTELHPKLEIELILSDSKMDLVEHELDILFQLEQPNISIYSYEVVFQTRRIFCASPLYFENRGYPEHPLDLLNHRCICLIRNRHIYQDWRYTVNKESFEIKVNPYLKSNNSEITHQWILDGFGVGYRLFHEVEEDLRNSKLIEIFKKYHTSPLAFYLIYPKVKKRKITQEFIKFIKEHLSFDGE